MQVLFIRRIETAEQTGQTVRKPGMTPFRAAHAFRALPGAHMDDRDTVFRCGQSRGQRRDGMAVDKHRGRGFPMQQQTGAAHDVGQQARIGKGGRGRAQPVAGRDAIVVEQGSPEGVIPSFRRKDEAGLPGTETPYRTFYGDMLQQLGAAAGKDQDTHAHDQTSCITKAGGDGASGPTRC